MCLGSAERAGGRSDAELLGCFKIETGAAPGGRADGVEAPDAASDDSEGIGAEFARGCAGGFDGIW
jgi:hypothetical protein